jgi:hypothetical protein
MSKWKKLLLTFVVIAVMKLPSYAQTNRAILEGTVTDPSGATISGARVKISAVDTGLTQERTTNSNGQYRFPGIAIGQYTVSVSNSGFKTKVIEDVILDVGQTRTLDVSLQIGEASERVDVVAETGPAERSSAEAAIVIRTDQIANLPVNGRDWSGLTLLAPFAQDDGGGNQRTIRYAGRAIDDNNFNIDGVDAGGIQEQAQKSQTRLQISEDAVAEYRVNTALYDAEYGTQAGGRSMWSRNRERTIYMGRCLGISAIPFSTPATSTISTQTPSLATKYLSFRPFVLASTALPLAARSRRTRLSSS